MLSCCHGLNESRLNKSILFMLCELGTKKSLFLTNNHFNGSMIIQKYSPYATLQFLRLHCKGAFLYTF